MFVSQASKSLGIIDSYGLKRRVEVVKNCRNISKKDMKFNDVMPKMRVDPESYVSRLFFPFIPYITQAWPASVYPVFPCPVVVLRMVCSNKGTSP